MAKTTKRQTTNRKVIVEEGKAAPAFTLPSSSGDDVSLRQFKGKSNVILYFYPKDNTSGCTKEACGFRDSHRKLNSTDTVVLGVSPDTVTSHQGFIEKFELPFELLADVDHAVALKYGAYGEKKLYGRKYFGIFRITFVVDKKGKIARIYRTVKPAEHAEQVLEFVESLA